MARLIRETVDIYKNKYVDNYTIRITRHFIDDFGKPFILYKLWADFSTKEIAERELAKPETIQSMINCGYAITK